MAVFSRLEDGDVIPPGPFQAWLAPDFKRNHCVVLGGEEGWSERKHGDHNALMVRFSTEYVRSLPLPKQSMLLHNRLVRWAPIFKMKALVVTQFPELNRTNGEREQIREMVTQMLPRVRIDQGLAGL